jgi:hypothetical protein
MNQTKGFLFTASIVLAMAFTQSCFSDEDGEEGGGGTQGGGSSSIMGDVSSSSAGGNSQSYSYCLLNEMCLEGPYPASNCRGYGGVPSNSCPYGVSSSSVRSVPSSSSVGGGVSSSSVGVSSSSVGGLPSSSSQGVQVLSSSSVAKSSSSAGVGKLAISGCPYTTSNASVNVWAVSGNPSTSSNFLSSYASNAAGSGIIASSGEVTWTGTRTPNGTFTIVLSTLISGDLKHYKATSVSLNNGAGSVSWSSFSVLP